MTVSDLTNPWLVMELVVSFSYTDAEDRYIEVVWMPRRPQPPVEGICNQKFNGPVAHQYPPQIHSCHLED